jgi:hypothetical protein
VVTKSLAVQVQAEYEVVEDRQAGAECGDGAQPPGERGRWYLPQAPGHYYRYGGAAEHHDVGVAGEGRGLQRYEPGQACPGAPPHRRLGGQDRPQQRAGAGRDQRGVGERRHIVPPGEQQRRARGAEQADGGTAAEAAQPAAGAEEQAQAAERAVEQRRQPDDIECLEQRGQEWVTRVFLADPPSAGQLHPLRNRGRRRHRAPDAPGPECTFFWWND